ncbi:MAG: biotin/lipoyl-binding protein, partial [Devosia sp.]
MLKQLLISLVVLIVAAAGYIYFVPGSDVALRNLGITAQIPTAYATGDASVPAASIGGQRAAGAAGGRSGGGGKGPQVQTVITVPVTTATINDRLNAIGQGTSSQSVSVTSQATGTLQKLSVNPGDTVAEGDIIGQLDDDAEKIAYDKANLAVEDASDTMQRTQTLAKTNNATTVQLSVAKLALDNANLELRNAKLALDKRSVTTPIGGTVGL